MSGAVRWLTPGVGAVAIALTEGWCINHGTLPLGKLAIGVLGSVAILFGVTDKPHAACSGDAKRFFPIQGPPISRYRATRSPLTYSLLPSVMGHATGDDESELYHTG